MIDLHACTPCSYLDSRAIIPNKSLADLNCECEGRIGLR